MPTFSTNKVAIDNAEADIVTSGKRFDQAQAAAALANALLQNLPTTYAANVVDINAQAAANPGVVAWQTLESRKDVLVSERGDAMAQTEAIMACFTAITDHGAAAVQAAVEAI